MSDTATPAAPGAGESPRATTGADRGKGSRGSLFARITLFVRQVVAELKKVVWPTRSELGRFTAVVLVFVVVIMAFVTLVDLGIGRLTFFVFSG